MAGAELRPVDKLKIPKAPNRIVALPMEPFLNQDLDEAKPREELVLFRPARRPYAADTNGRARQSFTSQTLSSSTIPQIPRFPTTCPLLKTHEEPGIPQSPIATRHGIAYAYPTLTNTSSHRMAAQPNRSPTHNVASRASSPSAHLYVGPSTVVAASGAATRLRLEASHYGSPVTTWGAPCQGWHVTDDPRGRV